MKFAQKRAAARATAETIPASMADAKSCYWCGRPLLQNKRLKRAHDPRSSTREHLVPRSMGGDGSRSNIVRACSACNGLRSSATDWVPWSERYRRRSEYPPRQEEHLIALGVYLPPRTVSRDR